MCLQRSTPTARARWTACSTCCAFAPSPPIPPSRPIAPAPPTGWLAQLQGLGFEASARPTEGHPMVVAKAKAARADAPHVLIYGHYDVQPVDPINLWQTDPFAPRLMEAEPGRPANRGAGRRRRQGPAHDACRSLPRLRANGGLPCNITILFEGEEESGSTVAARLPRRQWQGTEGRPHAGLRHRHVGPRHAADHLRCCAAWCWKKSSSRRQPRPAFRHVRRRRRSIRSMCCRESSPACMTRPDASPCPISTTASRSCPTRSSAQWAALKFDEQEFLGDDRPVGPGWRG